MSEKIYIEQHLQNTCDLIIQHIKNIINFQILFSLLTYFVFIVGVYGKITHNYSASIFLYTYFVLQFIVLIYPVFISIKIAKNDILYYYPNFFKIVK